MVGYDTKNKGKIESIYICQICKFIIREPVQLLCGHRYCHSCVENAQGDVIQCCECREPTNKKKISLDRGFKNDMQLLLIECILCCWTGALKQFQNHLEGSHPNPACSYCGKQCDSAINLDTHKLNECDRYTVPCPLKEYGCSNEVINKQMKEHYTCEQHQSAVVDFIYRFLIQSTTSDQEERGTGMDVDASLDIHIPLSDIKNGQLQEVYQTISILSSGTLTLQDDTQRLINESATTQNTIDGLSKDIVSLKTSIQEQNSYCDGIDPNLDVLTQDLASLQQKVEEKNCASYDGTFLWKIANIRNTIVEAKSGRQTSVYSPPFYSSLTGYKMRAQIYLNGNIGAQGTHVSISFVLMRGDYDAILKFPFNFKVTFCLHAQVAGKKNIVETLMPNTLSASYQRPQSDMNIACDILKFCSLSEIQQEGNPYIRDDTMFVTILVEFNENSKLDSSFVFSINPALPTNVQQQLIKQETERKTQQTSAVPTS